MRRFSFAAAAFATAVVVGPHAGHAYSGNAPWCAVVNLGNGTSVARCVYWSFEACRPNVIAGNRGFCNTNPYWAGQLAASPPRKLSRKRARY
jgi:hypothetical protein